MAQLLERLPPIEVQICGPDGPVTQQTVRLGETITIPPVVVHKLEDGTVYTQAKALGEPIRLQLVPRSK